MFNHKSKIITILIVTMLFSGCSVFMAAKQPGTKDVELFAVGTPRSLLLAEFGYPMAAGERDGKKYEVFSFVQGYSAGAKAGRAVFHGVADVVTLGLWEIIGTPTEGVFDGSKIVYEVSYDDNSRVDAVILLKD